MCCDVVGTLHVLEALDSSSPIGTAFCTGANPAGVALWRLSIRGRHMPGAFVVLHCACGSRVFARRPPRVAAIQAAPNQS